MFLSNSTPDHPHLPRPRLRESESPLGVSRSLSLEKPFPFGTEGLWLPEHAPSSPRSVEWELNVHLEYIPGLIHVGVRNRH